MKEKDNISSLFVDNQHKLEEQPSARVWEQLEKRLDQQPPVRKSAKIVTLRVWSIAAVFAALIVLTGLLNAFLKEMGLRPANGAFQAYHLEIAPADDSFLNNIPLLQNKYARGVIQEGDPGRQLIAAVNHFYGDQKSDAPVKRSVQKIISDTVKAILPTNFDWLVGEWKGNCSNGESVEQWKKTGGTDLQGKGYLVYLQDTLFAENMRLIKKGTQWFYVLQLDKQFQSAYYALEQFNETEAVFVNKKVDFPRKVVLKRHGKDAFSTILLPSQSIELSPRQLEFITQRNALFIDKAIRNVWRS